MAREAKKDPNELTVEQKLKTLFQLQTMLSKIDEIKTLRGELPLEVQDLEDEIAGLSTRIDKIKAEVDELKSAIAGKRVEIETAKASVEKYKSQQDNVRNNREYDFLTKEIEFQSLEIELCEKRIKEFAQKQFTEILNTCSDSEALKQFADKKIFKLKAWKSLGAFTALLLTVKPIDSFVESVIIKKVVEPQMEKLYFQHHKPISDFGKYNAEQNKNKEEKIMNS